MTIRDNGDVYQRILNRMRRLVLERRYVVTVHADDETNGDDLTVYDLESVVLTGTIVGRQRDAVTSEYKYKVRGQVMDGLEAEVVTKISITGKVVFITVYSL